MLELAYYGENGKRTYYFVPSEELKKVKPWSPVEGRKVPLSRDQAVEIARRAMSERGPQRPKFPP